MNINLLTSTSTLVLALGLGGCATQRVDAQWKDQQLSGSPLLGARIFVVCEAAQVVLSRLCVDRLTADLQSRGATVVTFPEGTAPSADQPRDDNRYLAPARAAGATALWAASVVAEPFADQRSGTGVSIGLGGFSFGGSGGVGVGVSVPIGKTQVTPQYAADARVSDAKTGRLLWTARAGSPPSGEAAAQLDNLLGRLVGAAGEARLF